MMIRTLKSYPIAIILLQMAIVPMSSSIDYGCDVVNESQCVMVGIDNLNDWNYLIWDSSIDEIKFTSSNFSELSSTTSINYGYNERITIVDLSGNHIRSLVKFHFTISYLHRVNLTRNEIENLDSDSIFEANPSLRSIDLSFNRIASISLSAFNGVPDLTELLLNDKQLKEINKLVFAPLMELRILELSANLIENFEDHPFRVMNNLEKLSLQRNNFLEFNFDLLESNKLLRDISLGDNNGIDFLTLVGHLKFATNLKSSKVIQSNFTVACRSASIVNSKLTILIVSKEGDNVVSTNSSITKLIVNDHESELRTGDFSRNLLTGHLSFENCEKLEILDLSFNQIQNVSFANRTLLTSLNLSHNNLTFIQNMTWLTNLKTLDVSFNCIENFEIDTFSRLIALEVLNLQQTCFKSLTYGTFSFQTKLIVLDISFNNLNNIDLELLSAQLNLQDLMIDGNNLTNIQSMDMIGNFLSIKSIGLTHNRWNCKTLTSLIKKLDQWGVCVFVENSIKNLTNIRGIGCTTFNSTQETLIIPERAMSINHTMYMDKIEKINEIVGKVNDLKDNKNDREIISNAIKDLQRDKSAMKSNLNDQIKKFKRFGKEIVNKFELLNEIDFKKLLTMKAAIAKLNGTNNEKYILIVQSIESLKDKLKLIQLKNEKNLSENFNKIARNEIKISSEYYDDLGTLRTLEMSLIALLVVLSIVVLYFVLLYC